jgi:hypothetical protein
LALDLRSLELGEIVNALTDQTDDEHRWLIKPQTGEIAFCTAETVSTARHLSISMSLT